MMLTLLVSPVLLAIVRLNAFSEIPAWAIKSPDFFSITRTKEELSIVCPEDDIPSGVKAEKGWRSFKVEGPLDFGLTGILSSLAEPLAKAKISIFTISTFNTDYILVRKESLKKAIKVLRSFCKIIP